jgi:hypothetical protein
VQRVAHLLLTQSFLAGFSQDAHLRPVSAFVARERVQALGDRLERTCDPECKLRNGPLRSRVYHGIGPALRSQIGHVGFVKCLRRIIEAAMLDDTRA